MADAGNNHLVIYGDSQGANIAVVEKRRLAAQYPNEESQPPDIDFVLTSDWNVPNGGLHARFPGLWIPNGWTFDGPEPTNTQFDTDVLIRQYDGAADFPLYPLNPVATLNALLGVYYVHPFPFDVTLDDPAAPPSSKETYGDTTYHFFETQDLPLFGPLRTLGVPEPLIDVVEPAFRVLADAGYDRSIPIGKPTPARLIPRLDPAQLTTDLVDAVNEGVGNAATLVGSSTPSSTLAAPSLSATTRDTMNNRANAAKSAYRNVRTLLKSADNADGSNATSMAPSRNTPIRDAVTKAGNDVKKAVAKVSAAFRPR